MKKYVDPSERDCAKSEESTVHAWLLRSLVPFLAVLNSEKSIRNLDFEGKILNYVM